MILPIPSVTLIAVKIISALILAGTALSIVPWPRLRLPFLSPKKAENGTVD